MYYRPNTNQVFKTQSEVRASFMSGTEIVMFSDSIGDDDLAARGVFPLTYTTPTTEQGQIAVPAGVTNVDGMWTQQWTVRIATPEELAANKPTVPQTVTRRQARQALLLKGKLDLIQPAINAISDATLRGLAQIEWDDSLEFNRNRALVIQIGNAVGLDSDGLDELFKFAAAL